MSVWHELRSDCTTLVSCKKEGKCSVGYQIEMKLLEELKNSRLISPANVECYTVNR